ncbi:MAG: ECF transporter S component [Clostridia bacterium]|nr:ECF transporter S component [Clostridia bacterium]
MNNRKKLVQMVTTALLMALILLFGLTPIGFINVGVVYITFLCIPVLIGTLALGLKTGLILGICMGSVSLFTGLRAPSALVAPILQKNILWVIILCYVPRLLVPMAAHGIRRLMAKENEKISIPLAAGVGSLVNTIFYLGFMIVFYWLLGIENPTLLTTIGTITLTAGLPEAAAAALISTPILIALSKAGLIKKLK